MPDLYQSLLGSRWNDVSDTVKGLHGGGRTTTASGVFRVDHGRRFGARTLARLLRMPKETAESPTRLVIDRRDGCEMWRRTFGAAEVSTTQFVAADGVLAERLGALELHFQLEVS